MNIYEFSKLLVKSMQLLGASISLTCKTIGKVKVLARISLVPTPLPDFIVQLWRKLEFSSQLGDKIWEWPRNEAKSEY